MTIAPERVSEVPVERALAVAGVRWTPTMGYLGMPSPRQTKKAQRLAPVALRVDRRTGRWQDSRTGRSGDDVVGLLGYLSGTGRSAALAKLAAVLEPRDLALDRCIRPGDVGRAGPSEGEGSALASTSAAAEVDQLRKFALHGTPRQRAAAIYQAAWDAVAADRRGQR